MTLDEAPTGVRMEVLGNRAGSPAVARRLAELGIRPGAVVAILSRTSGRGAILAIADDRIAVAREILRRVEATPLPQAAAHG